MSEIPRAPAWHGGAAVIVAPPPQTTGLSCGPGRETATSECHRSLGHAKAGADRVAGWQAGRARTEGDGSSKRLRTNDPA